MKLLNAAELTWDELRKQAQRGSLFMLCVAPLEDHASHLPCGTDPLICEAMATNTARLLEPIDGVEHEPQPTSVVLLPTWSQGSSLLQSLGCLRWKSTTVTQTLVEYGGELDKLGVRRLVLLSSHGAMDHLRALEKAARILRKKTRMNVLAPSGPMLNDFVAGKYNRELLEYLGRPFTDEEVRDLKGDLHAAAWETSLLLHIAPRLVENTYRSLPKHSIFRGKKLKFRALRYHRGYFGAPAVASEELGKAAFEMLCDKMADSLSEFLDKPLRHNHRCGLTPRIRKPKKRTPSARVPVNIALGVLAGWLLFRAMDRQH
ncbi:MAG: creatininase family protein [Vulcanimicrobiota bacterium]